MANDREEDWRMLADSVASFTRSDDGTARARRLRDAPTAVSHEAWAQLADLGWLGILVPEASGGMGLGVPEMAIVAEGLGRARTPEPFVAVAGFAAAVVAEGDNPEPMRQLLSDIAEGRRLVTVAWQETPEAPESGGVACSARSDGAGAVLSGRKCLVVPAEADDFIVSVRASDGIALYRVPADAPGLEMAVRRQMDGSRVADLQLDEVAVSDTDCVASPAVALAALDGGLSRAQVLASAELLGLADRLLEITNDYLGARKQFGQPLSAFQVLRHRAVDLYIQRELMRAALRHGVKALDEHSDAAAIERAASRVKARASAAAMTIAREAVQLHGAIGYTEEAEVGLYLHRILVLSAWLGNAAWHRRRYIRLAAAAA